MMLGTKYIVRENDTLWDLSNKFLQDPNKWPLIFNHNNSTQVIKQTGTPINDEDIIHVGQVLYIPGSEIKPATKPIKYVHFKSKARQYEKFKNSVFMQGVKAPITKIWTSQGLPDT